MPDEEEYAGRPWIAQCLSTLSDSFIRVQWFRGALTTPWMPDRRYPPTDIDVQAIINRVEFTPTHRLTKSSIDLIKETLQHLDEKSE